MDIISESLGKNYVVRNVLVYQQHSLFLFFVLLFFVFIICFCLFVFYVFVFLGGGGEGVPLLCTQWAAKGSCCFFLIQTVKT